jgi:hypothetical protein
VARRGGGGDGGPAGGGGKGEGGGDQGLVEVLVRHWAGSCVIWRQGKQSFFEKKDQKTFINAVADSMEKVFCFFFSKKKALP